MTLKDEALERIRLWEPGKPLNLSNLKLTRLPNIPKGVEILDCSHNNIRKIHSLPKSLKYLYCDFNEISYINNLPKNIEHINCAFNKLSFIDLSNHTKLTVLNIQSNRFQELPVLPDSILVLKMSFNNIKRVSKLPSNLETLNCYNCQLEKIDSFPRRLTVLHCENNSLRDLPRLPDTIINLNCSSNYLRFLPPLPESLKILICCSNRMHHLPPVPNGLESLYCTYNNLLFLPSLPDTLRRIDFRYNPMAVSPSIPMHVEYFNGINLSESDDEHIPNIPKEYVILEEIDGQDADIDETAFDTIRLEDVDVREYLNSCPSNVILKSSGQLYAYNRHDIRKWFEIETNRFICGDNIYFRLPWNQIIDYHNASKFIFLDYTVYNMVKTEDKIVRNNDLTSIYEIHAYRLKEYVDTFSSKIE